MTLISGWILILRRGASLRRCVSRLLVCNTKTATFNLLRRTQMAIGQVLETPDKIALVKAEVYRWYNLFFPWSRGVSSQSEGAIKPLYDALASEFRVVLRMDGSWGGRTTGSDSGTCTGSVLEAPSRTSSISRSPPPRGLLPDDIRSRQRRNCQEENRFGSHAHRPYLSIGNLVVLCPRKRAREIVSVNRSIPVRHTGAGVRHIVCQGSQGSHA
ncbi:hypothetical protein C4K23_2088 [Pseudomonas chlororaphis]|nr:hypothetical protein C4K23_2088 [Pseudomonas chlororaphis]